MVWRSLGLLMLALWLTSDGSVAQSPSQEIRIDCSAFRRQNDGRWVTLQKTTIQIFSNQIIFGDNQVPEGSSNGVDLQTGINQRCANRSSEQKQSDIRYAVSHYLVKNQTTQECLTRAREKMGSLPNFSIFGESAAAYWDGYTLAVRCTPRNIVFFALVAPADSSAGKNENAAARLKEIASGW